MPQISHAFECPYTPNRMSVSLHGGRCDYPFLPLIGACTRLAVRACLLCTSARAAPNHDSAASLMVVLEVIAFAALINLCRTVQNMAGE